MNLKTFAAALMLGASSTAAMAADLPSRRVAPAPVYAAPIFTWTGFYVGLQLGYAWDKLSIGNDNSYWMTQGLFLPAGNAVGWGWTSNGWNRGGVVGGGHIGYNWQAGSLVFGAEGDVEGTSIKNSALRASLRGRLGFAAFDRALLYVTGGLAIASGADTNNYGWGLNTWGNNVASQTRLGWTVGGGAEYAFSPNWSAKVEYRYSDFGRTSSYGWNSVSVRRTENAVRVGVSYHFNTAYAAPVVAKY